MAAEEDIVVGPEDVQFFKEHGVAVQFLTSLDPEKLATFGRAKKEWKSKRVEESKARRKEKGQAADGGAVKVSKPSFKSAAKKRPLEDDVEEEMGELEDDDEDADSDGDGIEAQYEARKRSKVLEPVLVAKMPIVHNGVVQRVLAPMEDAEPVAVEIDGKPAHQFKEKRKREIAAQVKRTKEAELEQQDRAELEHFLHSQATLGKQKEYVARLCSTVVANPERNLPSMKTLLELCTKSDSLLLRKLALLSLCAVFKDIIPGYKIRPPTAQELQTKVSKEVQEVREYEAALLRYYQQYVRLLDSESRKSGQIELAAIRAMCELLHAHPHFNFRKDITMRLVPLSNSPAKQISQMCLSALSAVLTKDNAGDTTLEIVKIVALLVKNKSYVCRPEILQLFLEVQFSEKLEKVDVLGTGTEESFEKKLKKSERKHLSKRQKKERKREKEIESDLREAEAETSRKVKQKLQTEILRFIMLTYFRILKKAPQNSPLLPLTMKGLAKYCHMISVEFLGDLLEVLKKLLSNENLSLDAALQCAITAFQVLKGEGEALKVDLKDFYALLYERLMRFGAQADQHLLPLALESLMSIFLHQKQPLAARAAAYVKRVASLCLSAPVPTALAFLEFTLAMLSRYPNIHELLDTEHTGFGIYVGDLDDPEHCNALSSTLWELDSLCSHYHPHVAKVAQDIVRILSRGNPAKLAELQRSATPLQVFRHYDVVTKGCWIPPPKTPAQHPLEKLVSKNPEREISFEPKNKENFQFEAPSSIAKEAASFAPLFENSAVDIRNQIRAQELLSLRKIFARYEQWKKQHPHQKKRPNGTPVVTQAKTPQKTKTPTPAVKTPSLAPSASKIAKTATAVKKTATPAQKTPMKASTPKPTAPQVPHATAASSVQQDAVSKKRATQEPPAASKQQTDVKKAKGFFKKLF